MDTSITISMSILFSAIILLIVFYQIRKRKKEKKTFSVLQNFAGEHNSTISIYDHWYNTQIGIDNKEKNILFFIRTISGSETREVINLSEIMRCRMVKTERSVLYHKEKINVIDRIALVLSFINIKKPGITLEFYNTDYDRLTLTGELQLAQKWSEIVNQILNTNKRWHREVNKARLQA